MGTATTMNPDSLPPKSESVFQGWTPNVDADIHLSDREHQVLLGIAGGLTNRELAEQLGIGIKTVESYRARLVAKLGVRTRGELSEYVREHNLNVSPEGNRNSGPAD